MATTKFKTIEVKGKKFDVDVDDDGHFRALHDHDYVSAPTLSELISKLAGRISRSKVKLSIPFVRWHEETWKGTARLKKGVITGIYASNKNVLVRWDGETGSEQETYSGTYIRPDAAERLEVLGQALSKAQKEFEDFVEVHEFDAKKEIRKALGGVGADLGEVER